MKDTVDQVLKAEAQLHTRTDEAKQAAAELLERAEREAAAEEERTLAAARAQAEAVLEEARREAALETAALEAQGEQACEGLRRLAGERQQAAAEAVTRILTEG